MSNISDCHNVRINELSWYSLEFLWVGSFYCFLFFFFSGNCMLLCVVRTLSLRVLGADRVLQEKNI